MSLAVGIIRERTDEIASPSDRFRYAIARVIDPIGIVTASSGHGVDAMAAYQEVVTIAACDVVVASKAVQPIAAIKTRGGWGNPHRAISGIPA